MFGPICNCPFTTNPYGNTRAVALVISTGPDELAFTGKPPVGVKSGRAARHHGANRRNHCKR